jgi:S1-C subfamily serine protease
VSPRAALAVGAVLAGCGGAPAAAPLTVLPVRVPSATQRSGEGATAFALGGGRALTVAHVLRAGHPVLVAGRRARVLHVDRRLDVAVLAIGGVRRPAPRRGAAHVGERASVLVIRAGAVRSLRATVRRTITARVGRLGGSAETRPALELAAAVMPGDSGAPVLDPDGRVVGLLFAQAAQDEALAYALDARALGSLLGP